MGIRSQDDYELFRHIELSWQSIRETIMELNRRNRSVMLTTPEYPEEDIDPLRFNMELL